MDFHFCTITTNSHLFKVNALYESLRLIDSNCILFVLNVDAKKITKNLNDNRIVFFSLETMISDIGKEVIKKYRSNKDKLRWSLKPVFLKFLLENNYSEKLVYTDNDVAFFGDYSFLFDALSENNIILTPHNYPRYPDKMQNWLEANFRVGLFNAGFIGVNSKALETIMWWANCCLYRCEKSALRGLFDDQKYLDLIPIIEPKTLILDHKGCNLAEWNRTICVRTFDSASNRILINNKWPIIFIHFNVTSLKSFHSNEEVILKPYFDTYINWLLKFKSDFNIEDELAGNNFWPLLKLSLWKFLNRLNNIHRIW
jgi:hypothetical protein